MIRFKKIITDCKSIIVAEVALIALSNMRVLGPSTSNTNLPKGIAEIYILLVRIGIAVVIAKLAIECTLPVVKREDNC